MPGMTLQARNKLNLEKALHNQLGTTDEVLMGWENNDYPADGHAVSKFWKEVENSPVIKIIGDYDVDGICASYIMWKSIRSLFPEKKVTVRIPDRFSEGYGINDTIVNETIEKTPPNSLIVTVDNGIAAAPILERLKNAGYKVIVTDHHHLREGCDLPQVDMLVDPAVESIFNPLIGRYWCGAGVAYKLCEPMLSEAVRKELMVYAGLATVADCMELKEGNWGLVRNAIRAFREEEAPEALTKLLEAMGQDPKFCNEEHFGFYLGPAFNAPGRICENRGAEKVLRYLSKPTEERRLELVEINNRRKELRDEQYEMVKEELIRSGHVNDCPIWIAMPELGEGIVGILAGKLTEEFKKPAIVLTNVENNPGMLKGSARNYGNFDIFAYLSSMPELFAKMGGHPGAAGLSMTQENFEIARTHQIPESSIQADEAAQGLKMAIRNWEIPGINDVLKKFRPFGQGNVTPQFEVEIDLNENKDEATLIGKEHNHLLIQDRARRYKLTHFNHVPNELDNPEHFGMRGTISGSAFMGKETPSFNANEVYDIDDVKERTR